jgi:hypothetical protein
MGDPLAPKIKYTSNVVCNQKYTLVTFLPVVLYEQFKFFFNLYFLLVALSQVYMRACMVWSDLINLPVVCPRCEVQTR